MQKQQSRAGISVIIPTMNRASVLLDTLRDLQKQQFRDFEIIVVDQSDSINPEAEAILGSLDIEGRYFHVRDFRGLPEARNYGWRRARREIVLYIDDDIRCGPEFLHEHYQAHLHSGATMVAGGITEVKGDRTYRGDPGSFCWWTATPTRNFHLKRPGWCLHAPGGNFSIRRDAIASIGGFDESLSVGAALYEETELGLRLRAAGHRCWFAPQAHLLHLAEPMGGCRVGPDTARYVYGMGHNRAIVIFRHLKPWHRPVALIRMVLFGLSYSRATRSIGPFLSALQGVAAGKKSSIAVRARSWT